MLPSGDIPLKAFWGSSPLVDYPTILRDQSKFIWKAVKKGQLLA